MFLTRSLRSMRVAIPVLAVLATVAALGTAVPRGRSADFYTETYGPVWSALIRGSGFDDVYHAWWFVALLGWLLLSMSVCSLSRARLLLRASRPTPPDPGGKVLRVKGQGESPSAEVVATRAGHWLRKRRYRVISSDADGDGHALIAEKGRVGRFGSLIIHAGAVVVLLGGALTALFGVSSVVRITEGETAEVPDTSLAVRLHSFSVDYHSGTDRVKEYRSNVSVSSGTRLLTGGDIAVNHPLAAGGFRLYQMNYRVDVRDVVVRARRSADGAAAGEYRLRVGEPKWIPELELNLEVTAFEPDFIFHDGLAASRSERFNNPAARLEVSAGTSPAHGAWLFMDAEGSPHAEREKSPYRFLLSGYEPRFTSGVKVVRDLGRPVVYAGFVILVLGSFVGCYVFHRRLDIRIDTGEDGRVRIRCVAGHARNPIDFERDQGKLMEHLDAIPCREEGTES